MNIEIIGCVSVLFVVAFAVWFDLTTYKIPNRLNIAGICGGLLYSAIFGSFQSLWTALLCAVAPIVILFPLFAFRIVGAGDVKLFAALGAYVHFMIFKIALLALVLASAWGLVNVCCRILSKRKLSLTKMHLSVPIGLATLSLMLL